MKCKEAIYSIVGTLPTNINIKRGRISDQSQIRCRTCNRTAETICHAINECPKVHDSISKRHNFIVKRIGKELKNVGWDVQQERTYQVGQERLRPDISASKNNEIALIDVTVPFENQADTLNRREEEKELKYRVIRKEHLGRPTSEDVQVKCVGIAIGSAGTICNSTRKKLRKLGLNKKTATSVSMSAIKNSAIIWRLFEK